MTAPAVRPPAVRPSARLPVARPEVLTTDAVPAIRDEIRRRVELLVAELTPANGP